jgi:hypothetical protein
LTLGPAGEATIYVVTFTDAAPYDDALRLATDVELVFDLPYRNITQVNQSDAAFGRRGCP